VPHILPREPSQCFAFVLIHSGRGGSHIPAGSRLYLHKTQDFAVPRNQVDITRQRPVVPALRHYDKSPVSQVKERGLFTALSDYQMLRQRGLPIAALGHRIERSHTSFQAVQSPICQSLHVEAIFSLSERKRKCAVPAFRYARTVTQRFRYLDTLTIAFTVVLVVSNLVGPKICQIGTLPWFGPLLVSGAQLLFPVTYICGDVFTEVYGYAASRRAIWLGFFAMGLLSVMGQVAVSLPPAPGWPNQQAFATVFGLVPRFAIASLIAYWAGEFTNSYTLAKLKLITNGRFLWTRTIGSTVTGQFVDTVVVILIAFWGVEPGSKILVMIVSSYAFKVVYETLATPLTYLVVNALKRAEGIDTFDRGTNFNPFAL
jgi:uncharacterized integral membrane protein (TIGR00697 family)